METIVSLWRDCVVALVMAILTAGCVAVRSGALPEPTNEGGVETASLARTEPSGHDTAPQLNLGPPVAVLLAEAAGGTSEFESVASEGDCSPASWWDTDRETFLDDFAGDVGSLFTRHNALALLFAGGVSFAFHETLDDDVAANTARHSNRWGEMQNLVEGIGNPLNQLAAVSGLYAYSLLREDEQAHDLSKTLFNAIGITALSTTLLKYSANTTRPNGDPHGWPSGHTSSSMAFAAVLDEYYGHQVGIPAYMLAGLVAWQRIDDRQHDLSDVIFGAALGYVIGRTVAIEHVHCLGRVDVEPYADPIAGVAGLQARF